VAYRKDFFCKVPDKCIGTCSDREIHLDIWIKNPRLIAEKISEKCPLQVGMERWLTVMNVKYRLCGFEFEIVAPPWVSTTTE
jgi:hypothetical protein